MSKHNAKLIKQENQIEPGCNCVGGRPNCPVEGQCKKHVIYRAAVSAVRIIEFLKVFTIVSADNLRRSPELIAAKLQLT